MQASVERQLWGGSPMGQIQPVPEYDRAYIEGDTRVSPSLFLDLSQSIKLRAPDPIGLGTQHTESLTSLIGRTAVLMAMATRDIIRLVYRETPSLEFHDKWGDLNIYRLFRGAGRINGWGLTALEWANAFETLTGRTGIQSLTMLPWQDDLHSKDSCHSEYRAWCPVCLEQWRECGQDIYEPLLWSLEGVLVCPTHRTVTAGCKLSQ